MAEEAEQAPVVEQNEAEVVEETVPKERYISLSKNKKAAEDRAKDLERSVAELQEQMQERESAGLPELERLKKDMERLTRRAEEAEQKAQDADSKLARSQKERWVTSAATANNFADPSDAAAFVDLDEIEDHKDAERAVKRLASQKKHLLKAEESKIPGRVLENGQPVKRRSNGGIDAVAEAQILADGLRQFASKQ